MMADQLGSLRQFAAAVTALDDQVAALVPDSPGGSS